MTRDVSAPRNFSIQTTSQSWHRLGGGALPSRVRWSRYAHAESGLGVGNAAIAMNRADVLLKAKPGDDRARPSAKRSQCLRRVLHE